MKKILVVLMFVPVAVIADTINMTWKNNGATVSGPISCVYGETFSVPDPPEAPAGYVFGGWKVTNIRTKETCGVESLATATNGTGTGYIEISGFAYGNTPYGLTENGTWGVTFSYGMILGEAMCSTTSNSTKDTIATPTITQSGKYCYCRITEYIPSSGTKCVLSPKPSKWVFEYGYTGKYDNCSSSCSNYCASRLKSYSSTRSAMFSSVAQ